MATIDRAEYHSLNQNAPVQPLGSPFSESQISQSQSRIANAVRLVNLGYWKYLLVIADMLLIGLACVMAYIVRYNLQWFRAVDPASEITFGSYLPIALTLMITLLLTFRLSKVYPYQRGLSLFEEVYTIAQSTTYSIVILITISLVFRPNLDSRLIFLYIAIFVTLLLGASRLGIALALRSLRRYGVGVQRILLIGAGDVGRMVMRNITARPELGYQLIGFLDDNPIRGRTDIGSFPALGSVDNLKDVLGNYAVQRVIICLPWQSHRTSQRLMRTCEQASIHAQVVPDLFQLTKNQMAVEQLNGIPLISVSDVSIRGWNLLFKRVSDILLTLFGGLLALPILVAVAFAIRLESPGPIFYGQTRVGKDGQPFCCYKFRSMVVGAEEMRSQMSELNEANGPWFKVRDDPRLTKVGRFLRRISLDELPQLYNVLRGDMSLVGPRPNLPEEVAAYEQWHRKRLSVSPGITGLWQVSGRSDLTFDEMVLLDIYYVENWSIQFDLSIIMRSVPAVLLGRGAY